MRNEMKRLLVLAVLALLPAAAAQAEGAAGYWTGELVVPAQSFEMTLDLVEKDGSWSCKLSVPQMGLRNFEGSNVTVEGSTVKFGLEGIPGEPVIEGTVSEDGSTLEGHVTQAGQQVPMKLTRGERPADADVDIYAEFRGDGVPGEGLAGDWKALIEQGPFKLRLILHVTQDADGNLSASVDSLDQGTEGMDVDDISIENGEVYFDMLELGAAFEGKMNADGSAIEGNWTQGQQMPLTFKRAG